jgi:periplasmic protein TonB
MTSLGLRLSATMVNIVSGAKLAKGIAVSTAALLLTISSHINAAPLINGISVHTEFNKERFIGALYSETLSTDARTILQSTEAKRLELRITAKRLSARRLSKMWIEGMAINNSGATLSEQAQNMVKFTSLIKRKLVAGDHLVIDYIPGEGTKVRANDTELGTIESDAFFNLLLRTWIGSVPLSSDFRAALLTAGDVDGDLLARFEATQPSENRLNAFAKPAASPKKAVPAAVIAAANPAPAVSKPAISAPALVQAPTLAQAPSLPQPEVEAPAETTPDATPAESTPTEEVAATDAPIMSEDEVFGDEAVLDEEAMLDEDALLDEEADEDLPLLTAESLLSRQLYHSKLLKWTYKYIRYPKRAVSRGHEGSVRLTVTIDREGNVQNVAEMENSKHSTLNKEAMKAVARATPFPPVPEDVTGTDFEFSLPIVFRLPK